jgi:hypothetical protein
MAFTGNHLALRLAVLLREVRLLSVNPTEARYNRQPNGFFTKPQWRRYPHATLRRINPNVKVFYILMDNLHSEISDIDKATPSSHAAPL